MLLNTADSLIPIRSSTVITATMNMAGRFRNAPVVCHPSTGSCLRGALDRYDGIVIPKSSRKLTT